MYLILIGGLVALAGLPWGHTYYKVFDSSLSCCSPVAMASGSCQSPPPPLHAAMYHVRYCCRTTITYRNMEVINLVLKHWC